MTEKFTKGEWEVKRTLICNYRVKAVDKKGKQGKVIGDIRNSDNAHLIAAAPEMYELLAQISGILKGLDAAYTVKKIDGVLAKARGED